MKKLLILLFCLPILLFAQSPTVTIIYSSDSVILGKIGYNEKISLYEMDVKTQYNEGLAPYFREQLRAMLKNWCSTHKKFNGEYYDLYSDGLKVYTTIDSKIQQHAEQAVKNHMRVLQKEFYEAYKGKTTPYPRDFKEQQIDGLINQAVKRSERYKNLKKRGKSESEIEDIFNIKVNTSLFSWQGAIDTFISPRDSIIWHKWFLHTGLMSMDPNTGHVKAYVGGINHHYFQYDYVKGTRQVGSTFKPFLYSLAIQEGMNPCDKRFNSPVVFDKDKWGLEKDWIPKNSSPEFNGLKLSLKFGLANSLNIMTASIMKDYGPKPVIDIARKMGVTSYLPNTPSLCLGVSNISVKEITAAYSTFVNQGVYTEPIFITKITDKNGVTLEEFSTKTKEALSKKTAAIMVELLKSVVNGVRSKETYLSGNRKGKIIGTRGTGMSLRRMKYRLKSEIGGKTGTTQNYSDGWFVGITPNLVTSVWVGCEDRAAHFKNRKGYGSYTALPIFGKFMRTIYDDQTITSVTEQDIFEYDVDTRKYVEEKMNCNPNNEIIFDEDVNEEF